MLEPVWDQRQRLRQIFRPVEKESPAQEPELIAEGYEYTVRREATLQGHTVTWQERRLVVRSVAWAQAQHRSLLRRLEKAQAEIAALHERRPGQKVYTDTAELRAAGEQILAKYQRLAWIFA